MCCPASVSVAARHPRQRCEAWRRLRWQEVCALAFELSLLSFSFVCFAGLIWRLNDHSDRDGLQKVGLCLVIALLLAQAVYVCVACSPVWRLRVPHSPDEVWPRLVLAHMAACFVRAALAFAAFAVGHGHGTKARDAHFDAWTFLGVASLTLVILCLIPNAVAIKTYLSVVPLERAPPFAQPSAQVAVLPVAFDPPPKYDAAFLSPAQLTSHPPPSQLAAPVSSTARGCESPDVPPPPYEEVDLSAPQTSSASAQPPALDR